MAELADRAGGGEVLRLRITISGIVQGVGFRPFAHNLAASLGLAGRAFNTPAGLTVEVEGPAPAAREFTRRVRSEAPPLSSIEDFAAEEVSPTGERGFEIARSDFGARPTVLVSPDVTVCDDCRRELLDPADRRHGYPFINCTNCGPRYTIINRLPYDRPRTTMSRFEMCPECLREYQDPSDRRFHAQPNACARCGPRLILLSPGGGELASGADAIERARSALAGGSIVAVKGLGGFHLAVDAGNDRAVLRLRERKHREEKPLAVMVPDIAAARECANVSEAEELLLSSPERPIVLLAKLGGAPLAASVAPRSKSFGIMLPYTPLHILLLRDAPFRALVMTSGNVSEEPIAFRDEDAVERLGPIADLILSHDRPIAVRNDDSVVRVMAGRPVILRRSRGYAPRHVKAPVDCGRTLALGGMYKNTVCITRGRECFVSQHIGDLENPETLESLRFTVRHLSGLLEVEPERVVCDMHPEYLSTKIAPEFGLPVARVQHHHAHIAGVLAENGLQGPAVGIALDGTGFGEDGTVWGGEILVASLRGFRRAGLLSPVALPGGDAAVRDSWRMAVVYELAAFGGLTAAGLDIEREVGQNGIELLRRMIERGVNTPVTTSCGRLFDAVSAELGVRRRSTFEGQAAMELEGVADASETGEYPVRLCGDGSAGSPVAIDSVALFRAVAEDAAAGASARVVAARFHNSLATALAEAAARTASAEGLGAVALSGGCFQNAMLLKGLVRRIEGAGLRAVTHRLLPPNDGGLSFGQAVAAAARGD